MELQDQQFNRFMEALQKTCPTSRISFHSQYKL